KRTAEHFINFLLEPENAARTAQMTGYMPANMAAYDLIPPEVHAMLPDEEERERLEWYRPLDEEGLLLWDQTWTEIRASQ
ncbi:MAG: spermidine/putrescine ABC transporter substrate-binding protein, partial [Anaerolineae bacterium]|nr:spermidine/putrescine ABC transporter substrate-binding protein [Anaerolineae bacterium]